MHPRTIQADAARSDLAEIAEHLARESVETALRFLERVEVTLELLVENPGIGRVRFPDDPEVEGLRSWPVGRFGTYLIFYRPVDSGIEVVRILHGARDIEGQFSKPTHPG